VRQRALLSCSTKEVLTLHTLLALLLASTAAYLINRLVFERLGTWSLVTVVPLVEELLKTGLAVLLQASLWWVHVGFGALEASLDIRQRPRPAPMVGYLAAWCSVIGHGAFGAVTMWGWSSTGSWLWGYALGSGLHLLWNVWVVRLAAEGWEGLS
jgi:hypothetical protein